MPKWQTFVVRSSRSSRDRCDPLADIRRSHWLAVSDLHRNLIACKALPVGANPRVALPDTLAQCAVEGWQAESDGAYGVSFVARGSERRLVNLTPANPSNCVGQGHAVLAGRGAINQP